MRSEILSLSIVSIFLICMSTLGYASEVLLERPKERGKESRDGEDASNAPANATPLSANAPVQQYKQVEEDLIDMDLGRFLVKLPKVVINSSEYHKAVAKHIKLRNQAITGGFKFKNGNGYFSTNDAALKQMKDSLMAVIQLQQGLQVSGGLNKGEKLYVTDAFDKVVKDQYLKLLAKKKEDRQSGSTEEEPTQTHSEPVSKVVASRDESKSTKLLDKLTALQEKQRAEREEAALREDEEEELDVQDSYQRQQKEKEEVAAKLAQNRVFESLKQFKSFAAALKKGDTVAANSFLKAGSTVNVSQFDLKKAEISPIMGGPAGEEIIGYQIMNGVHVLDNKGRLDLAITEDPTKRAIIAKMFGGKRVELRAKKHHSLKPNFSGKLFTVDTKSQKLVEIEKGTPAKSIQIFFQRQLPVKARSMTALQLTRRLSQGSTLSIHSANGSDVLSKDNIIGNIAKEAKEKDAKHAMQLMSEAITNGDLDIDEDLPTLLEKLVLVEEPNIEFIEQILQMVNISNEQLNRIRDLTAHRDVILALNKYINDPENGLNSALAQNDKAVLVSALSTYKTKRTLIFPKVEKLGPKITEALKRRRTDFIELLLNTAKLTYARADAQDLTSFEHLAEFCLQGIMETAIGSQEAIPAPSSNVAPSVCQLSPDMEGLAVKILAKYPHLKRAFKNNPSFLVWVARDLSAEGITALFQSKAMQRVFGEEDLVGLLHEMLKYRDANEQRFIARFASACKTCPDGVLNHEVDAQTVTDKLFAIYRQNSKRVPSPNSSSSQQSVNSPPMLSLQAPSTTAVLIPESLSGGTNVSAGSEYGCLPIDIRRAMLHRDAKTFQQLAASLNALEKKKQAREPESDGKGDDQDRLPPRNPELARLEIDDEPEYDTDNEI